MRYCVPYLVPAPGPAALLRRADDWAAALDDPTSAHRAISELVTTLASLSEVAEPSEWALLRSALAAHPLVALLRRDPLVSLAWRALPGGPEAEALLDDLMLRHPSREEMVARADAVGRNVHAATSSLPACDATRDRRRMIARCADQVAEERQHAEILGITLGYLREAEASLAGPAGRIGRWVALVPSSDQSASISRAMPLPWVVPVVGNALTTLLRPDRLGSFDLVYCKALETMSDGAAEALAVAAFARVRRGGRLLLGCRAPGALDAAFWAFGGKSQYHLRDETRLARLVSALPPQELGGRKLFSSMNEAISYLEIEKV